MMVTAQHIREVGSGHLHLRAKLNLLMLVHEIVVNGTHDFDCGVLAFFLEWVVCSLPAGNHIGRALL